MLKTALPLLLAAVVALAMACLLLSQDKSLEQEIVTAIQQGKLSEAIHNHIAQTYLFVIGLALLFALAGLMTYRDLRTRARLDQERQLRAERDRADKALEESELRFHVLFDQMIEGFALHEIITDESGKCVDYRFLEVNPAFEATTGLRGRDIIGKTARSVLPNLEPFWIETYGRVALTGEPVHFERSWAGPPQAAQSAAKTGIAQEPLPPERHYEITAFCPRLKQFAVIVTDISDRKRAQERTRQSLSLLRATLESTVDGILVVSCTGRVTNYNSKFVEMWRIPQELLKTGDNETIRDYAASQLVDPEQFLASTRELYAHPERSSRDLIYFRDGRVFARYSQAQRIDEADWDAWSSPQDSQATHFGTNIAGRVWCYRDITALKQAEETQRRYSERLRLLKEIAQGILAAQSLQQIAQAALRHVPDLVPCVRASIAHYDFPRKQGHILAVHASTRTDLAAETRLPLEEFPVEVIRSAGGGKMGCQRFNLTPDSPGIRGRLYKEGVRSVVSVPLVVQTGEAGPGWEGNSPRDGATRETSAELMGSFNIASDSPDAFSDEHVEVAREIADSLAIAMHRREVEEALRQSESNHRTIFNSVSDAIIVYDASTGAVVDVNQRTCQLMGCKRLDVLSTEFSLDFWRPQDGGPAQAEGDSADSQAAAAFDRRAAWARFRRAAAGEAQSFEWLATDHHGMRFWVDVALHLAVIGARTCVLAALRDISQRKRAEDALRTERDFAENLIETAHALVIVTDIESRVVRLNRFGQRLLGQFEEEFLGRRLSELLAPPRGTSPGGDSLDDSPDDRPAAIVRIWQEILSGKRTTGEVTLTSKEGREIPMRWYCSLLRDTDGTVNGVLTIANDISELKAKEDQLRQAQKMEAVGRLAGGIAHDFNNQLTVVKGYCDLLLKSMPADHPHRNPMMEIQKAAARSATMTSQLLTFSRKQILHPVTVNINTLLAELDEPLSRMIGEDVRMAILPAADLGNVTADTNQFEQAVVNLAINARDAMPHGGRLTIETANVTLTEQYALVQADIQPGRYVMLAVSDTGIGMDAPTLERVFEPFFTTKPVGQGTGLGLPMVYGFVKQSGGHIHVYSEPGTGTTFKLYFPRVDAAADLPREAAGEVVARGEETVLIVEDDPSVRRIVNTVLAEAGYHVLSTDTPDKALLVCEKYQGQLQLLVTDVVMPETNGPELAKRILVRHPEMKVLYITGYTENAIVNHGIVNPGIQLLEKPFTPSALAGAVRRVLDAKS